MPDDDNASFGVVYDPDRGPRRKLTFEPRADGQCERIEAVWTGCDWRVTGREVVSVVRRLD